MLVDLRVKREKTFWQRQTGAQVLAGQTAFDVGCGVLLPFVCFMLDPGILRSGIGVGVVPLARHKLFIYAIAVIVGLTLTARLTLGDRLRPYGGFVAGILMGGSMCSFLVGIIMLPLTLIGLFIIVGVLGFAPLIAAFVYMRNGIRSLREAAIVSDKTRLAGSLLLGAALGLGGPAILEETVSESVEKILQNDATSEVAAKWLNHFSWAIDTDAIALAYEREADPGRKGRLAAAYRKISGTDVETRLAILRD